MKNKTNILIITLVLTFIVFGISIYIQKKMINYEATTKCLVLTKDILENELVSKENFKDVDVPISLVATQRIVKDYNEIDGLYAKDNIKSGQIAIRNQFDTKENLSIYETEIGKEKLSIKIKSAENGMSFQINQNSVINVYATLRNEYAFGFLEDKERCTIGNELDGYTVIKVLENVKVLGVFNVDGLEVDASNGENLDSVLVAVNHDEAKHINLIREIATFNVTGVGSKKATEVEVSGEKD